MPNPTQTDTSSTAQDELRAKLKSLSVPPELTAKARDRRRGTGGRRVLYAGVALMLAVPVGLWAVDHPVIADIANSAAAPKVAEQAEETPVQARIAVAEQVQTPAPVQAAPTIVGSGFVTADRMVTVFAPVNGTLNAVYVGVGDSFAAGQTLARIDTESADQTLARAEATLARARDALAMQTTAVAQARDAAERAETLAGRGSVPRQVATDAGFDLRTAEHELALAQSDVRLAELARATARTELDRLTIRAPFSGMVVDVITPGGSLVPAGIDGPILRIFDPAALRVRVEIAEARLSDIQPGQPASAAFDARPGETFAMTVAAIVPEASVQKSTVTVVLGFDTPPPAGTALPNMSARVSFDAPVRTAAAQTDTRTARLLP